MCADSILFFPFCFSLSFTSGVFGVIRNHPIIPSPFHLLLCCFSSTSTPLTLLSSAVNPPSSCFTPSSSHYCVLVCGWVSSLLYSTPPLPLLVKERMRLEREEATRLLEEETEVRHSSSAGPQTSSLNRSLTTNTTELLPLDSTILLIAEFFL